MARAAWRELPWSGLGASGENAGIKNFAQSRDSELSARKSDSSTRSTFSPLPPNARILLVGGAP
jgi:hypothetical protein